MLSPVNNEDSIETDEDKNERMVYIPLCKHVTALNSTSIIVLKSVCCVRLNVFARMVPNLRIVAN